MLRVIRSVALNSLRPAAATGIALALAVGSTMALDRPATAQDFNSGDPDADRPLINYEAMNSWFDSMKKSECATCHDGAPDDLAKGRFTLRHWNDFRTSIALRHGETRTAIEKASAGDAKLVKKLFEQPVATGLRKPLFQESNEKLTEAFQCSDEKGTHDRALSKPQKEALELWRKRGLMLQAEAVASAVAIVEQPKSK